MVFRKIFRALGRVLGFRKRKKRRASRVRRYARRRRRPVSRRRPRYLHRRKALRRKKRAVRHKTHRRPGKPAHRAARPSKAAKRPAKSPWVTAGEISHYFTKVKAAVFKCRVALAIGDAIWVKGKNTDFRQTVGSMQIDRKPIERASKGQEIGLEVLRDVYEGDRVYLAKT